MTIIFGIVWTMICISIGGLCGFCFTDTKTKKRGKRR